MTTEPIRDCTCTPRLTVYAAPETHDPACPAVAVRTPTPADIARQLGVRPAQVAVIAPRQADDEPGWAAATIEADLVDALERAGRDVFDLGARQRAEQVQPRPPERAPFVDAVTPGSRPYVERLGLDVYVGANAWHTASDALTLADRIRAAALAARRDDPDRLPGAARLDAHRPARGGRYDGTPAPDAAAQRRSEALRRAVDLVTGRLANASGPVVGNIIEDTIAAARAFEAYVAGTDTPDTPDA